MLLQADGAPLTPPFGAVLTWSADGGARRDAVLEPDGAGRFRLRAELPERFELRVQRAAEDGRRGAFQRLELRRWPADVEAVVRLAPWHEVRLELEGFDAVHARSTVTARLRLAVDGEGSPVFVMRSVDTLFREETAAGDALRTFSVLAGPGRYRIDVRSALLDFDAPEIEVGAAAEPVGVRLAPR